MKVTVCELSDNELEFIKDWDNLKKHIYLHQTDLLLLPELPFCKWIASEKQVSEEAKLQSVKKHEEWLFAIERLNIKRTVYTKPVMVGDKFYNTAFVYEKGAGHRPIHTKAFFPEEPHFWEETWYNAEVPKTFDIIEIGQIKIGVLLCTEMWFTQYARQYGKQGIDLLLCPRATGAASVRQWIRCGQTLSIISGAYCLSSNRCGDGDNDFRWGGKGWITAPADGELLGITSTDNKFITLKIDLKKSRKAKLEYPLYVRD
jgi:predicted amidohydrolase